MKISLLPNRYKIVGWLIFLPGILLGLLKWYFRGDIKWLTWIVSVRYKAAFVDISHTVIVGLMIVGGLLVAFSKEKKEDEYISNLRLSSFQWALLISYLLLFLANFFLYGWQFLNLMALNMFTPLFLFILRFNYLIYRTKN